MASISVTVGLEPRQAGLQTELSGQPISALQVGGGAEGDLGLVSAAGRSALR